MYNTKGRSRKLEKPSQINRGGSHTGMEYSGQGIWGWEQEMTLLIRNCRLAAQNWVLNPEASQWFLMLVAIRFLVEWK